MKMLRKLNFEFVDNTLYKIEYHGPGRNETDKHTVIAAYHKTDEKFHYEFGHPYDLATKKITSSVIGIRTQEFHKISPVDPYERHYWKEAVADFMLSMRRSGGIPTCVEDVENVDLYREDTEVFDFQKIRSNHYRLGPLNYKDIYDNLVTGLSSYVNRYHLKSLILGVSGGIDSTVVAAIACEVCKHTGCELIGLSLPTSTNENDEITAADLVGAEFCTEFHKKSITNVYEAVSMHCAGSTGQDARTHIAEGNIKARLRMLMLYDMASIRQGIVLDTDNLSEHYLGFYTVHGDVADFNPIGHLWKHEVYGLAKWMLKNVYPNSEALKASIALTPTDGNGVQAGGDIAQIAPGHTYEDVDDILMTHLHAKECPDDETRKEIMRPLYEKYGDETVTRVIDRYVNSDFKRRHAPLVIDIFDANILENDCKLVY